MVSARLSKLVLSGVTGTVQSEEVLVEDWCNQFGHTIGTVAFGADGMLYAGGGDGAAHGVVDYGQFGGSPGSPIPVNPCGDPPTPTGTTPTPDTAKGGALRTQAAGTTAREATTGMIPDATTMVEPLNFGWPCYEGKDRQVEYKRAGLGVCDDLYGAGRWSGHDGLDHRGAAARVAVGSLS